MSQDRRGTAWVGLGLIGLGITFLLAQWLGWDKIWPVFPLLGGLAFLAGYIASGFRDAGLAFVGTAAALLGLFFFGFSLGFWEWGQMSELWPVFPLIGGVAFVVLFLAQGQDREIGTLGVGCAAIVVGIVGLAITYRLVGGDIVQYWPLLLVLLGFLGLASALVQGFRRE